MNGNLAMGVAISLLLLILPVSALIARRMPLRQVVTYAAAWIGIFAALALLAVAYRSFT